MFYQQYTDRERRFIDWAARHAQDFSARAADHDREASFPFENYGALKESGYIALNIPEEFGGAGATLLERIKAQEKLAEGCGSTALAVNMHFNTVSMLTLLWQKQASPHVARLLGEVAAQRLVIGGSFTEPGNAIGLLRPQTRATRVDGGWRLNGAKIFSSQSIALDRFFSEATWDEAPGGPVVLTFLIPVQTPALSFKEDWNAMGMRATASNTTAITDAFLADENVVLQRPTFTRGGVTHLFNTNPLANASIYIGLALAARNFLVGMMSARKKPPLNRPLGHLPNVRVKIGEMDALIEASRAVLWKAAVEFDRDPPDNWTRKAAAAKMIAIENSSRVLDLGMRVAGGSSFSRKFPLERMFRDVKAGLFHPLDTDQTLDYLGLTAFGLTDPDPGIVEMEAQDTARRTPVAIAG